VRHGRPIDSPTHYVIEGERFASVGEVLRAAIVRGFRGSEDTMRHRLGRRVHTWQALTAPVNEARANTMRAIRTKTRGDAEAAAVATDERRRIIAAQTAVTETEED
jgi:hypothetical protein